MELKDVREFLEKINPEDISFDSHFYKRSGERPISESMIRSFISNLDKLEKIEFGKEKGNRFKVWFKMSRKYSLVLIIDIYHPKGLKVISAWNSDKKWQDKLKQ